MSVFAAGLGLFWMGAWVLATTGNVHLVPSVLLMAALLLPVTFMVFLHGRMHAGSVPVPTLALTALVGGTLGLMLASVFESAALAGLGILPVLVVGLIEEAVKLLAPTVAMMRGRRSRADAVLLGVISGLGFATFETLGYAFAELLRTDGEVSSAMTVLLVRALLAPAGHAAWTGVTAVAVWRLLEARQGARGARNRYPAIALALLGLAGNYGLAVVLHSTWNLQLGVPVSISIALLSLWLLRRQLRGSGLVGRRVASTPPDAGSPPAREGSEAAWLPISRARSSCDPAGDGRHQDDGSSG
jgi:RsiW-degrading membrane proteinase PrsW (M82 family)